MNTIGKVTSVWRYPVKSMRGESLESVAVGPGGLAGDRLFAFKNPANRSSFPWVTGREHRPMILCEAGYAGDPQPDPDTCSVRLPDGRELRLNDPALAAWLSEGAGCPTPELISSDNALADCYPVSLFSLQTSAKLAEELGRGIDWRRFRANFYVDLDSGEGFGEDSLVGKRVRIGDSVVIDVEERDPRCAMVTFDPDTAESDPKVLRQITAAHDQCAGVYASVATGGVVNVGDPVVLLTD